MTLEQFRNVAIEMRYYKYAKRVVICVYKISEYGHLIHISELRIEKNSARELIDKLGLKVSIIHS